MDTQSPQSVEREFLGKYADTVRTIGLRPEEKSAMRASMLQAMAKKDTAPLAAAIAAHKKRENSFARFFRSFGARVRRVFVRA